MLADAFAAMPFRKWWSELTAQQKQAVRAAAAAAQRPRPCPGSYTVAQMSYAKLQAL
jgi:hypothetical protein